MTNQLLYFIGIALKNSQRIADKYIPLINGVIGILLAVIYVLASSSGQGAKDTLMAIFTGTTQGVLCAGASVYANQLIKQSKKEE